MDRPETYPDELKFLAGQAQSSRGLKDRLSVAVGIDGKLGQTNTLPQRLYEAYQGRLGSLLSARNNSILAHGFVPVGEKVWKDLFEELERIGLEAAPAWPTW